MREHVYLPQLTQWNFYDSGSNNYQLIMMFGCMELPYNMDFYIACIIESLVDHIIDRFLHCFYLCTIRQWPHGGGL